MCSCALCTLRATRPRRASPCSGSVLPDAAAMAHLSSGRSSGATRTSPSSAAGWRCAGAARGAPSRARPGCCPAAAGGWRRGGGCCRAGCKASSQSSRPEAMRGMPSSPGSAPRSSKSCTSSWASAGTASRSALPARRPRRPSPPPGHGTSSRWPPRPSTSAAQLCSTAFPTRRRSSGLARKARPPRPCTLEVRPSTRVRALPQRRHRPCVSRGRARRAWLGKAGAGRPVPALPWRHARAALNLQSAI
mmetsp:Transcript_52886/g.153912  ORF Transcript_52886/g.153912 Transcript_52886/m.153912 type:complete len:248 (+) Transcript_52886:191-934(+)